MLEFKDMESIPLTDCKPERREPLPEYPEPSGTVVPNVGISLHDLDGFFNESQEEALPVEMIKLAEEYGEEKRSIKAAENKIKARKTKLAEQEATLFGVLEGLEMDSFSSKGWTYFRKVDSYATVDAAETGAAHKWIKDAGFKEIIKLTVNCRSLTSVLKEVFEVTGDVPGKNDGIKVRTVNRVGVRKK